MPLGKFKVVSLSVHFISPRLRRSVPLDWQKIFLEPFSACSVGLVDNKMKSRREIAQWSERRGAKAPENHSILMCLRGNSNLSLCLSVGLAKLAANTFEIIFLRIGSRSFVPLRGFFVSSSFPFILLSTEPHSCPARLAFP
jgi:hypothetical protein